MSGSRTYPIQPPRADLERVDFEQLIYQKGRRVWYEKALECPCKSISTNQQSSCRNCGGTGWLYINGRETRVVITGVGVVTEYKSWSEESRGMINISSYDEEELCFMDRLTLLDSKSIFQEVLHFRKIQNDYIAYSRYPINKLLYGGIFLNTTSPLQRIQQSVLLQEKLNLIKLSPSVVPDGYGESDDLPVSVTVRYQHSSVYYILEMKRETMQSFKYQEGNELLQHLPLSAIARRAHYMNNSPILIGDRLIDNSFEEERVCESVCNENIIGEIIQPI